ncbi:MmcQ/YjbR family DNA-binding protein [Chitinophaga sancti]|uniref:MmcQ/YjbR family DNA-binding protein n=1 Tax=Chitinophaga sancti TaxID=1004 RepID=A0A1K1R5F2_9BACT|nr:MmcQ/YjbR family DNA-binding protein [Chitinophaga sancti]WQD64233.1 MmcQ/YjbR family DNA-binding protein [Chitinophaga sancti]WQG90143.1 MmcQ/YjbR family DNA-binding protein [Chitinophaga sancti]SFW67253.1 Predicted DNA-binding protein, MmcQ/YjbR family [Chitinophaga sancti]
MNVEEFRNYCLSFKGAHEGMPFEGFFHHSRSILVMYVKEKMFCFFNLDKFDSCTIKCRSENIEGLKIKYDSIEKPFNLSPKYWISVGFNGDVPDELLKSLVHDSYHLVVQGLSKKEQEELINN